MEIFKIIAIGIGTSISVLILKSLKAEFAVLAGLAGGCLILFIAIDMISGIFGKLNLIVSKTGLETEIFKLLLKILGIGYLTEFSANICSDSGNSSIAEYITLGGRVVILVLSFPIILNLLNLVVTLL